MRSLHCVWLCFGLAGCFTSPPGAAQSGSTSGGSTSSATFSSAGVTTNVDPSTATTSDAESSSSSDAATSSSSSGSATGDVEGCPGAGICFPPAPAGWDGPAIVLMGQAEGMDPMCPPGAEELWRAGTDPAAQCDCSECGGEIDCQVGFGYGSNGFCETYADMAGCQPFSSALTGQFWMSMSLSVSTGAACESPEPGEPVFRERAVGCAPAAELCEGGVCLLEPACISRPGERDCPPAYEDRSVLYMSAIGSDLSCDTCGCGDDGSGFFCFQATVSLYGSADCAGDPIPDPEVFGDDDMCTGYPGFVLIDDIASVDIDIPPADCSSSRGLENASGDFVEVGPRTVCCSG